MKNCLPLSKRNTQAVLLLGSAFFSSITFAVEQNYAVPGTRAMGMAGAFVAMDSDISAIWYNPASITANDQTSQVTVELGELAIENDNFDDDGREIAPTYTKEQNIKFAAFSKNRISIAFVQPYQFNSAIYNNDQQTKHDIAVNYSELKLGASLPVTEYLDIGTGMDIIRQSYNCDTGCNNSQEKTSKSIYGFGFGVGVLGHWDFATESQAPIKLNLGANFRTAAQMNDLQVLNYEEDLIATRPQSVSLGTSVNFPFMLGSLPISATASLHFEKLKYDPLSYPFIHESKLIFGSFKQNEKRNALGLEFSLPVNTDADFYLRTGYANTKALSPVYAEGEKDLRTFNINTTERGADSQSFTLGLGYKMPEWLFDLAAENRKITQNVPEKDSSDTLTLISVSASYLF